MWFFTNKPAELVWHERCSAELRRKHHFKVKTSQTTQKQMGISIYRVKLWNSLEKLLQCRKNPKQFKSLCKESICTLWIRGAKPYMTAKSSLLSVFFFLFCFLSFSSLHSWCLYPNVLICEWMILFMDLWFFLLFKHIFFLFEYNIPN